MTRSPRLSVPLQFDAYGRSTLRIRSVMALFADIVRAAAHRNPGVARFQSKFRPVGLSAVFRVRIVDPSAPLPYEESSNV